MSWKKWVNIIVCGDTHKDNVTCEVKIFKPVLPYAAEFTFP